MKEKDAIEWICNSCGNYTCDEKGTCEMLERFLKIGIEKKYIKER